MPHNQLEMVNQSAVQSVVVAFTRATTGPKRPIRPRPPQCRSYSCTGALTLIKFIRKAAFFRLQSPLNCCLEFREGGGGLSNSVGRGLVVV